jgi:type VI secretion system secreted protein Hcp
MQTDYFLDIQNPKIPGESQQTGHVDQIEMDDWSFGCTQSGTAAFGSGASSGRVSMQDFQFSKRMDASGPKLQKHCSTGTFVSKAVFTARRSGEGGGAPVDYLRFYFDNMIISAYQISGGGDDLRESISFNFEQVKIVYKEIVKGVAQGSFGIGYNVKENRVVQFTGP